MNKNSHNRGFSTLELLIAFAVLILSLTAVVMVAFGNQSNAIDTELAQRGLYIAQQRLEEAGAAMGTDFTSITSQLNPVEYSSTSPYDTQISVSDISECAKKIESTSFWKRDMRNLKSSLQSIFISPEASAALGGDCLTSAPTAEWDNPISYNFADLISNGSKATDVDTVDHSNGNSYAVITSTASNNKNTLWLVDVTNPNSPETIGGFEDKQDYNAIDAVFNENSNLIYAFIAAASSTAQLQVVSIDLTDPDEPVFTRIGRANLNVTESGTLSPDDGRSIYFYNDRIYIGTHRIATGNEFQIFDVSTPSAPTRIGSKHIDHNVNKIQVLDGWAYLATSDNGGEIIALDVSDPILPIDIPDFNNTRFAADGNADATALYVTSQFTYLGRERENNVADLFVVRTANIRDTTSNTDGIVSAIDLDTTDCTYESGTVSETKCLGPNTAIRDISITGHFAFLVTTKQTAEFQVWDISNPQNPMPNIGCNSYQFPAKPTSIDFHNNVGFATMESSLALRIIYDQPGSCTP